MVEQTEPVIVVGVDGSNHSKEALRWAAGQARGVGGRVLAVMSWDWSRNPFDFGPGLADGSGDAEAELVGAEEKARQKLKETITDALGADPGVVVRQRVVRGAPAQVLVDASKGASLTVVGTRGYGGFKGALLGSVSQQVVQYAASTVVVVRDNGDG
ncbi:universal stress protein [Streptomyces sp. NPDC098789]|uniref:universal stress protein n=1 Tax=Streptomyces sp. NPDC098789 TaxID=3366098 RepID=UPI003800FEAC